MSCLLLLVIRSDDCRIRWLFPLRHALHLPSVAPCCRRSGQFRDMKTGLCAATRFCTRCCGRRIRSIRFVRICAPIFCFLPSFRAVSGHASKPNCFVRPGFLYGQGGRDRLLSCPLPLSFVPVGSGMRKPGRRKATRFGVGSVREHCRFGSFPSSVPSMRIRPLRPPFCGGSLRCRGYRCFLRACGALRVWGGRFPAAPAFRSAGRLRGRERPRGSAD